MKKLIKKLNSFKGKANVLVILGSGLNEFINETDIVESFSLSKILGIKTDTSIGHNGNIHLVKLAKKYIYILEGRKHYYENPSDKTMREIIQAFAYIGIETLVVTNAAGGMNPEFKPGDIMMIDDHINMLGRNPLVGENNNDLGPRFVDMSVAYDKNYRKLIDKIAKELTIDLKHGIYVSYLGPSYETPAEIKAFRLLGGDAVGMSTVPEVIVARHAGIKVLGISIITNMASGISKEKLSHDDVLKTSKKALSKFSDLLINFLKQL
ncbi:MAG: purine-nucleoside phosphorylase [Candidatus Izimaplasma sp.]|nr:purine-nucleoside phosphorylase [Candidatus Izimaplasma bacterium]